MNNIRYLFDELRVIPAESGMPKIVGYAAVFNAMSEDLGGYREKILPGAFRAALDSPDDILALMHHDPKMILGRRSKGTLKIKEDERGLAVEITPPDTTIGRDAIENVRRGDIAGMSFRMNLIRDNWAKDSSGIVRTIEQVGLLREVTLTPIPAYPATTADVRSCDCDTSEYVAAKIAALNATPDRDALAKRLGY